jgi:hypothetical protein
MQGGREVLDLVANRGGGLFQTAIERVGQRLTDDGCIDAPDDVNWLEWMELRDALVHPTRRQSLVAERMAEAERPAVSEPLMIGPTLPSDAPRMYLIREVLQLFG